MDYKTIIEAAQKFGFTKKDICLQSIGVFPEEIHENVILAPWWEPSLLPELGEAYYLSESDFFSIKSWNIVTEKGEFTYIKTGVGARALIDALLALGLTNCKKVLCIGTAGSLDADISIGDVVVPMYSVCGDGASRYIASDDLKEECFGEKLYPDKKLFDEVRSITEDICRKYNVKLHIARDFCVDAVIPLFKHVDIIRNMNCNVVDMEIAAAFRTAKMMNIQIAAVFCVSADSIVKSVKSSMNGGKTKKELEYHKFVRRELFPQIILETFFGK